MTLLGIAWRNIGQRPLTSSLTVFSLALGVGLVVATLITGGIVRQAFESGTGLGYNMIVGAKGSPLQLVLNSVYYISKPIENISWEFYSEFLPASRRSDGEDGDFAASVAVAAPICMGDYYRGYRVIGTNADLFGKLQRSRGRSFEFADGRNLEDASFFEAVLGASVAAETGLRVGDAIKPTHGADDGPEHDPYVVVGVVAATDTPIDRGVFVNMEGFYLQEGHAKPLDDDDEQATAAVVASEQADGPAPLPEAQREVTSILVKTASLPGLPPELTSMGMRSVINEGSDGQAVLPIGEIRQLLDLFVWPLERLLLLITVLVVIVSAVGILVSMVGSSLERTRDVAIMRALGARRSHVLLTVLLAGCGGFAGWALGHLVVGAIGPWIATNAGVSASVLSAAPGAELLLVPFLMVLAVAAGLLPAIVAYRTDVARWLQRGG